MDTGVERASVKRNPRRRASSKGDQGRSRKGPAQDAASRQESEREREGEKRVKGNRRLGRSRLIWYLKLVGRGNSQAVAGEPWGDIARSGRRYVKRGKKETDLYTGKQTRRG